MALQVGDRVRHKRDLTDILGTVTETNWVPALNRASTETKTDWYLVRWDSEDGPPYTPFDETVLEKAE